MSSMYRKAVAHLALASALSGLAVLRFFPPQTNELYPRCPVFEWLHVQCPGCGATRALAALLNGQLRQALHWNMLFVLLSPILAVHLACLYWRAVSGGESVWIQPPERWVWVGLIWVGIFTVARNLP